MSGLIKGYDQKKKNFYTVTAQSEEHRDMQVLMLELSGRSEARD